MTTERPTFEAAFEQLEAGVRRLEAGGLPLEEAITVYEETMRLAAVCQELLDGAELRVRQLQERLVQRPGDAGTEMPAGGAVGGSLLERLRGDQAELVPCPSCQEPIPANTMICLYCGQPR